MIDEALSLEIPVSTSKSTISIQTTTQLDKCVDNVPKTKSIRTQYNTKHFTEESHTPPSKTVVKIPTRNKYKDAAVNTELSFKVEDDVVMTIRELPSTEYEEVFTETEEVENEMSDTSSYVPEESDEEDIGTYPDNMKDNGFIVYWSCLLPLLQFCLKCHSSSIINQFYIKGTLLLVKLFCKNGHETSWEATKN